MSSILKEISESVIQFRPEDVISGVKGALDQDIDAQKILDEGLLAGMSVVGEKFKADEVYIPEVLVIANAMNEATKLLKPSLAEKDVKAVGSIVIGTVKGDLHDIGKNLVAMVLEGSGFKVVDVGIDVGPERFIEAANEEDADIIALSALLSTTVVQMKTVVEAVNESDLKGKVKILIGGPPTSQEYSERIGADGWAPEAASAVDTAKGLIS